MLALILAVELLYLLTKQGTSVRSPVELGPKQIGMALFGPYVLGVELASVLLLAGLVGAYHLGRPHKH
jgi:NADH-quinone oxidoreductase subunit J